MEGEIEGTGQRGDESFVFLGFFPAELVVEVRDSDQRLRGQFAKQVQQADRVGSTGDSGDHTRPRGEHVVSGDSGTKLRQHLSDSTLGIRCQRP